MAAVELTDDQIALLSGQERQELIWRLARPARELMPSATVVQRMRRFRLGVMVISTALLIPWIIFLGITLPSQYVARNWTLTWLGFDAMMLGMFGLTVLLGFLRRQLVILTSFASGILLICDAWFDVTTAEPKDIWWSVASAALIELPIAFILISGATRLVRFMAARLWYLRPGAHLWDVPIPIPELWQQ